MYKLTGKEDGWKTLPAVEVPEEAKLPVGPVIVPLAVWRAKKSELIRREHEHGWPLGVWLSANEGIDAIENDVDDFTVIAIEFDRYSDGIGYVSARTLRKIGYSGELRAFGEISGKIARLKHFGFDSFSAEKTAQRTAGRLSLAR